MTNVRAGRFRGALGCSVLMRGVAPLIVVVSLTVLASPVGSAVPGPSTTDAARFAIVPAASTVTYKVGETFFTDSRFSVAVGTTHAIQGDVFVDRAHPANSRIGTVTVDVSTFKSDRARRDSAIREGWLESAKFPTAQFTPTAVQGLPVSYTEGQEIPVQITGNLRVRDVTKPTTFTGTIRLAGDTLTGTLGTMVLMTDFGFDPPSILGILKAENQVKLELHLTARRAPA